MSDREIYTRYLRQAEHDAERAWYRHREEVSYGEEARPTKIRRLQERAERLDGEVAAFKRVLEMCAVVQSVLDSETLAEAHMIVQNIAEENIERMGGGPFKRGGMGL